ncbi:PAS domain-containing protein [Companilactobacillus baiquanensis]|uniref:PAS domain-containing protein n=1 Tax=Companilactobacillus baiquanensis TaxID=2486005 RepID=A0ABW1URZ7_9LACO|nr:PAS domain-containing protein [Companilactobacillus baiquanensis]
MSEPEFKDGYVNFKTGRLSLKEIQQIFNTLPFEVDFIDQTDHFRYFSDKKDRVHKRSVDILGETVEECHPAKVLPFVKKVIDSFKNGQEDQYEMCMPLDGKLVYIQYFAIRDEDKNYLGTMEFTGDISHIKELVSDKPDATTGASKHDGVKKPIPDAMTGASKHDDK